MIDLKRLTADVIAERNLKRISAPANENVFYEIGLIGPVIHVPFAAIPRPRIPHQAANAHRDLRNLLIRREVEPVADSQVAGFLRQERNVKPERMDGLL